MDYLASNPELWNRQQDSGAQPAMDSAFDDWLNGYLAEVLPAQPEQGVPAQMPLLPDVPPERFPWEDQGAGPVPGHDIGSSTSGGASREQALQQAGPSQEIEEEGKANNRAARIADKNRC